MIDEDKIKQEEEEYANRCRETNISGIKFNMDFTTEVRLEKRQSVVIGEPVLKEERKETKEDDWDWSKIKKNHG